MLSRKDQERMKKLKVKMADKNAVNRIMAEEEAKIDRTMDKLAKMDEDDLEELRAKRLEDLRRKQMQRSKWYDAYTLSLCGAILHCILRVK